MRRGKMVQASGQQRREGDLSRPLDATGVSEPRKRFQRPYGLDNGLCHMSRRFRTTLCNVVADPFEVIRSIRRPADAHQPR